MASLSALLFVVLAATMFISVSANTVVYTVTFVACTDGLTCPQGNPSAYSATFALNNTLSPNVTLNVGDTLVFNLATTMSIHPLTICQNSPVPNFCQGVNSGTNLLNTPITNAGSSTSATFNTAGTYYYGCGNHPGMGAIITVVQTGTSTSSSVTGSSTGTGSSSSSTGVTGSSSTTTGVTGSPSSSTGVTGSSSSSTGVTGSSSTTTGVTGSPSSSTGVTGSLSTTTKSTGDGHQLSASFLFIAVIPLLTMIFI